MAQFPKVAECVWLLIPAAALVPNVLIQIIWFRFSGGSLFLRSMITGFAGGLAVLALLEAFRLSIQGMTTGNPGTAILVDAPTYAALSYCYLNFAQLGQTSLRIRLYAEIAERPDGLAASEIARAYNDKAMMNTRLQRLIESGDVVVRDDRYYIGRGTFVPVANIMFAAKRLLLGRENQFQTEGSK